MSRNQKIDMVTTPLASGIIKYSIPLILSGLLQIFYNAADLIVVGRFAGANALASVGATGSLITLFVNFFINFSIGVSVIVAREIGAKNYEKVSKAIHTSYFMAIIFGLFAMILGITLTTPMLNLMKTPAEILKGSEIYMKIYFLGVPASLVYNFGASVLNASGDSKKPLYYLGVSGFANVVLNIIFVVVFKTQTTVVAIGTIVSQYISAFLVTRNLLKQSDYLKLTLNKIKFYKKEFMGILAIGVPSGIQSIAFSLSNITIQSSINHFGAAVVAGNAACASIEGFTYVALNSIGITALNFSAQNVGAGRYDRVLKTFGICLAFQFGLVGIMGLITYFFADYLLGFYVSDYEAIKIGAVRFMYVAIPYFLCGFMETAANMCRAMGYTMLPVISTMVCVCGLRILWIQFVFPYFMTLESIYISYPISWVITFIFHLICFAIFFKKEKSKYMQ